MRRACRVLVVEDDPTTLDLFSTTLRKAGFAVEGTPSGLDALRTLTHHRYAAVVADHVLPDVQGMELLAILHRALPGMPLSSAADS